MGQGEALGLEVVEGGEVGTGYEGGGGRGAGGGGGRLRPGGGGRGLTGGGAAALPAQLLVHLVEGEHRDRGRGGEGGGVPAPGTAAPTTGYSTLHREILANYNDKRYVFNKNIK